MTRLDHLFQWRDEINQHLPGLSKPQASELAWWSFGMVLAGQATLTAVSLLLAAWVKQEVNTVRQHLRDWYLPASHKSGKHRADWSADPYFAPLLAWVLGLLPPGRVLLALDACNLKDRLTILCVSVLVGNNAIPVAFRCLVGNVPDPWQPHWIALLDQIESALPIDREVLVLTDRGLWASWLYEAIASRGWHPLTRINAWNGDVEALFRPRGQAEWLPLSAFAPERGQQSCRAGEAFKTRKLPCTLLVFWGEDAKEPWYLLTDSCASRGSWYGQRFWIEHQFKTIKSDGWQWQKSRVTEPERIERLWLAYAVALLWTLSYGSQPPSIEAEKPDPSPPHPAEGRTANGLAAPSEPSPNPVLDSQADPPAVSQADPPAVSQADEIPQTSKAKRQPSCAYSWFRQGIAVLRTRIYEGARIGCMPFYKPQTCVKWA